MINKFRRRLATAFVLLFLSSSNHADVSLKTLNEPESAAAKQALQNGVFEDTIGFINQVLDLDFSVTVLLGADDGPAYDPQTVEVLMPWSFVDDIVERFDAVGGSDLDLQVIVDDVLIHTLLHEMGHVLVDQLQIPVVGREEDAVDGLANVLILEHYEDGAEMAISASQMFELEGADRGELQESDFWGEHSLDEQRAYSILCHVYGSRPAQYADLIEEAGFSEDRAELCEVEFEQLVVDWSELLDGVWRE